MENNRLKQKRTLFWIGLCLFSFLCIILVCIEIFRILKT